MNNFVEEKFREVVWNSTIPIKIDMALEDVNDVERPPSLYFNIPRIGYIANILVEIKTNFEKYLPPNTNLEDIWFDINKTPLKWHIPFGVLIDSIFSSESYDLPVHIIAHFRSFPENVLIHYKGRETLKLNFMNSLKESNTIKYGSNKEVLNLSTSETMKLLDIIFTDGKKMYREFWEINKKFLNEDLKKIPIKVVLNKTDVLLNKPLKINTKLSDYESYTLENFLNGNFSIDTFNLIKENMKVIIHGQEFDMNTPILFIAANFSYLDNYLYISLTK